MKKVLFVATVVKRHINAFHIPFLKLFKECGWETSVASKNDYTDGESCKIPYCDNYYDTEFSRSPFSMNTFKALAKIYKLIKNNNYDIIHCHTPVGGVVARIAAARFRSSTKVIYTAHGFHFYKGAPLLNWLLYFPAEWICSFFTDILITINKEDYKFAKKNLHAKKTIYVPGVGIDIKNYSGIGISTSEKKKELGLSEQSFIILSVGELNKNKNHKTVLKALSILKNPLTEYVICGDGPEKEHLISLAKELNVNLKLLGYRKDIAEILSISDLFVFPSQREGLPLALMEALACGTPVVCSDIRGNRDLVKNGYNGFLCEAKNSEKFAEYINRLITDNSLKSSFAENSKKKIIDFSQDKILQLMKEIYEL